MTRGVPFAKKYVRFAYVIVRIDRVRLFVANNTKPSDVAFVVTKEEGALICWKVPLRAIRRVVGKF